MTTHYWIGVASRDHVKAAENGGFCQFCHGRDAPARQLSEGDGLVYYSPRERMGDGAPLRAFTAIGRVRPGKAYLADQSEGFTPWRRDVAYQHAIDIGLEAAAVDRTIQYHGRYDAGQP
ncbi:EVE domain-containing protein [Acetobacter sp.]|jgi:hypothetical protein|uniref:EVE domain-containing protein n=1 Tax=Acetobacter sp. TaxID=440 RepID=UPI0025BF5E0A|nr:EVE domain-containing protein [Acetobacter sp.]MCH4091201.1 EVE domain-containing protein [Acetobacter sp.]MCI1301370.1 EVE domain-containing protein [Acetobacter sp.]